jgi:UDPglucose 6-dehydrogenase
MNLTVIGTGYVGLVTGTCFAEMGNQVTCVDVDQAKIAKLEQGMIPIYEPGLEAMVAHNYQEGRLRFTTSLAEALQDSDIYFIAVGTPPGEDGSADLQYVLGVARELGRLMHKPYNLVVDKSTVPVGTGEKVREAIAGELRRRGVELVFDVVSNPEFLKEGDAVEDFMRPDRVIVGTDSEQARKIMRRLYAPFTRNRERMQFMGLRDAEMVKYAANAMLATKISFMNEIANLCERMGVDVENVRSGMGSDQRIGYHFIYPGCGYGGSCFPKDVKALIHMAESQGFDPLLLNAVENRNARQKERLAEKIMARFGGGALRQCAGDDLLAGYTFAVWGLAFKPNTDDMREASSLVLLERLLQAGARIKAYDPAAMEEARHILPAAWFERLELVEHQYDALAEADALVLVTEWKSFRHPDFSKMKRLMKQAIIFDGRNQYDPQIMREMGFEYSGMGR